MGSEMCIRDSYYPVLTLRSFPLRNNCPSTFGLLVGKLAINTTVVKISIAPVPEASICRLAFDADVAILLSVMLIASSMFKIPVTFAPVVCTLNFSLTELSLKELKIISFAVPEVPSNLILAPSVPADPKKLMPGTLALSVL